MFSDFKPYLCKVTKYLLEFPFDYYVKSNPIWNAKKYNISMISNFAILRL